MLGCLCIICFPFVLCLPPVPERHPWYTDYFYRENVRQTDRLHGIGLRQRAYSSYQTVKNSAKDCYASARRFGSYQVKKHRARHREPQTHQQPDDCLLLRHLPPDLILSIADQLPIHSRIFFSWTCRTVMRILRSNGLPESRDLLFEEAVDFLAQLGRDRQGRYVCEECLRLHRITLQDTPARRWWVSCPAGAFGHNNLPCMLARYALDPRHVQLALKYSRMENRSKKSDKYLEKLLKPQRCPDIWRDYTRQKRVSVCFVSPRVVRGRFILQTVWMYPSHEWRGDGICEEDVCYLLKRHRTVYPWYNPAFALVDEVAGPRRVASSPPCRFCWPATATAAAALHRARDRAKRDMGIRIMGYDRKNPVDFAVMVEGGRVLFWSWQDLGGEGSPLDLAWRRADMKGRRGERRMGYAPGGVRKVFDEGKGDKKDLFEADVAYTDMPEYEL